MGALQAIYLRPAARLPIKSVRDAEAIAGRCLEGDHAPHDKRQVTILSRESWDDACRDFGRAVDPSVRRANLLVTGIDLGAMIGKALRIGSVVIDIHGETRPCELMDDSGRVGLCAALRPERRGGVFGSIRAGGQLQVGDECAPVTF